MFNRFNLNALVAILSVSVRKYFLHLFTLDLPTTIFSQTVLNEVVALGPAAVNLGTAGNFAILAETGISTVPSSAVGMYRPWFYLVVLFMSWSLSIPSWGYWP